MKKSDASEPSGKPVVAPPLPSMKSRTISGATKLNQLVKQGSSGKSGTDREKFLNMSISQSIITSKEISMDELEEEKKHFTEIQASFKQNGGKPDKEFLKNIIADSVKQHMIRKSLAMNTA